MAQFIADFPAVMISIITLYNCDVDHTRNNRITNNIALSTVYYSGCWFHNSHVNKIQNK